MWLVTFDASSNANGRVSLAEIVSLSPVNAGGNWRIDAVTTAATTLRVSPETFASSAAALTGIDDLLLNGS